MILDDFGLWEVLRGHFAPLADEASLHLTLSIDPALASGRVAALAGDARGEATTRLLGGAG